MPGACQAEWADDKIKCLLEKGHQITVISSICAKPYKTSNVYHIRVPSLSAHDFKDELNRVKNGGSKLDWYLYFLIPINYILGNLIDGFQYLLTKGIGEGRWSWIATSFVAELITFIRFKPDVVVSTGGPASAHVSSIMTAKIFRKPVIVELQDPLSGGDIGRNLISAGWLYKVEKFIINHADKIVYVTKAAASYAKKQFLSPMITYLYPGAWNFKIYPSYSPKPEPRKYKLIHLGSLYATRNFRSIIGAIDLLIKREEFSELDIELLNLGHVSPEINNEIAQKSYVKIISPVNRVEALRIAADCDVMLLIQNSDNRSQVTIPYKTYDYLNLNNNILGILNSDELSSLLLGAGHLAFNLNDIDGISKGLMSILKKNLPSRSSTVPQLIDPIVQASKLIELGCNSDSFL